MGVRVIDTTPEIRIAVQMVTANSRKILPRIPLMNRMGMNTAASEMVIERIENTNSLDHRYDASMGVNPFSMCRTMFSSITMASSTTKQTDRINAIMDSVFRL